MIPKKRFGISKNFRPILKSLGKASVKSPVFLCHLSLLVLKVNFPAGLQFCFFLATEEKTISVFWPFIAVILTFFLTS